MVSKMAVQSISTKKTSYKPRVGKNGKRIRGPGELSVGEIVGLQKITPKKPLAELAKKANQNVKAKGLDLDAIIINVPEKVARAVENAERHLELSGMTIREALATRRVESKDLRYDLDKGFMKIK